MRPGQSKGASLIEALTNIMVGVVIAFLSQLVIFGWYGISVSHWQNAQMTGFFTIVSLIRSYVLRRIFNRNTREREIRERLLVMGWVQSKRK
jgi:membrane protein implicated in regulation of membrane protease activity